MRKYSAFTCGSLSQQVTFWQEAVLQFLRVGSQGRTERVSVGFGKEQSPFSPDGDGAGRETGNLTTVSS